MMAGMEMEFLCGLLTDVVPLFDRMHGEYHDSITVGSRLSLRLPEGFDRGTGHAS
jgi:hypothetical protein